MTKGNRDSHLTPNFMDDKSSYVDRQMERKCIEKMHTCICPRCTVTHKHRMFWTGTAVPRIFCHACRVYVKANSIAGGMSTCRVNTDHVYQRS